MNSHFHLLGTLGEPLRLETSTRGIQWGQLLVTVERRYKDREGTWKEESHIGPLPDLGQLPSLKLTEDLRQSPMIRKELTLDQNRHTYETEERHGNRTSGADTGAY